MRTYKIHLIRHGLTQGNLEGKYIGSTDLPLCPQGMAQLEGLLQEGEYPPVDRVYTSPLLRARQTAELLFPDRMLVEEPGLRELEKRGYVALETVRTGGRGRPATMVHLNPEYFQNPSGN